MKPSAQQEFRRIFLRHHADAGRRSLRTRAAVEYIGSVIQKSEGTQVTERRNPGMRDVYPFAAIAGQEEMKRALLLSAIDPRIGGVLIMGDRGTGKSTAVRALADLLPPIARVRGCLYGCDPARRTDWCGDCSERHGRVGRPAYERAPAPVVDLPLGATEDRVCGTLDIERALARGVKAFEPGLLARANRGFLYIDEVNLLEDHLVDLLLDVAASGQNVVEREGIGVRHPARFVLVGSGNPQEGELRPQLLDRFGLYVVVATVRDVDVRMEIVRMRERFDSDPAAFRAEMEPQQADLRERIVRAKRVAGKVEMHDDLLRSVSEICVRLNIDGHRGELTIMRAARAWAAFEGRTRVAAEDVRSVAVMSLRHRLRKNAMDEIDGRDRIERALEETLGPIKLRTIAAGRR
jgi:magnesium chelatase subunit I